MRQSMTKKKSRGSDEGDDAKSSFKRLGGRGGAESSSRGGERENGSGDEGPKLADRAGSGVKAADHLSKAAAGGKLRQAFSLWRASHHLRTAAAGTGELVKRYPAASAALGGLTAAGAIYFLASRAAADASDQSDSDDDDAQDQSEDQEESEDEESEDQQEEDDESEEE